MTQRYVATTGSDGNDGSQATPWATIAHAANLAQPGDVVNVAAGTYGPVDMTGPSVQSGTSASARITFKSTVKWGAKIVSSTSTAGWWIGDQGSARVVQWLDIVDFEITAPNAHIGINVDGSHIRVIGCHIHHVNNTTTAAGGALILEGYYGGAYQGTDLQAIGNYVHHAGGGGNTLTHLIYPSCANSYIANNVCHTSGQHGIHGFHYDANPTIVNNLVLNCPNGSGILIGSENGEPAITSGYVANNIVVNCGAGMQEANSRTTGIVYRNNQFWGNGQLYNINSADQTNRFNDVNSDPGFVNFKADGTGDYHLAAGSVCIGTGTTINLPATDYDGLTRAAADRGPYAYSGSSTPPPPPPPPPAVGQLYVATTGSDATGDGTQNAPFATIAKAASIAQPGTTVNVAPGSYGPVSLTAPSGTAAARITYRSTTKWGAKIVSSTTAGGWVIGDQGSANPSYIDVVDFEITAPNAHYGVLVDGSYCRVMGCHVHDVNTTGVAGGAGIDLEGYFNGGYNGTANMAIGNRVNTIGAPGNPACTPIHLGCPNAVADNNIVYDTGGDGIHAEQNPSGGQVVNNLIFNCPAGAGVYVGDGPSAHTTSFYCANNIIASCQYGYHEAGGVAGSSYHNNRFWNCSAGDYLSSSQGNRFNDLPDGDPGFKNWQLDGTGDYHLTVGSACISTGTVTNMPATDYDGVLRPTTVADVGPYAYIPAGTTGGGGGGTGGPPPVPHGGGAALVSLGELVGSVTDRSGGKVVVPVNVYDVNTYFRLVAFNRAGVASVPTPAVSGLPVPVAVSVGMITTTQITDHSITTPKLAAGAVTTNELSANAVTAGKVNAGAIDGMAITGALIQTSPSGSRAVLTGTATPGELDYLKLYNGGVHEAYPGTLYEDLLTSGNGRAGRLVLRSGAHNSDGLPHGQSGASNAPRTAQVLLNSQYGDIVTGAVSGSSTINLQADLIQQNGLAIPRGRVGSVQLTADSGTVNSGNELLVSGGTFSFVTTGPNRRLKVTLSGQARSSVAGDQVVVRLRFALSPSGVSTGSSTLVQVNKAISAANRGETFMGVIEVNGLAAGTYNAGITLERSAGAGTCYLTANALGAATTGMVEDIGG